MVPNLFRYATKELSQDAFICWLLDWANAANEGADKELHAAGQAFLTAILAKHNRAAIDKPIVELHRQDAGADVVAVLNNQCVLLIEDKIAAGVHGNQLDRYVEIIGRKFPNHAVLPTFIKTRDQSNYSDVESAGYKLFLRNDFLNVMDQCSEVSNLILRDFSDVLKTEEVKVNSYKVRRVNDWVSDHPWIGFYKFMQERRPNLRWDYVPNASGGFLGAWWHGHSSTGCEVYLQIEQGPLCIKIGVEDKERQREMRETWHSRIMSAAQKIGRIQPRKPGRFGLGSTMTVAIFDSENWLASTALGILDVEETFKNIVVAEQVLTAAMRV